jgi:hypothetical protein
LWVGHEDCDFGAGNVGSYGGCNADCTWAPRCGDGAVDAGLEECDLGALNGTGMKLEDNTSCSQTCGWQGRLGFITSTVHDGALGGVQGADLLCRNVAMMAGLANASTFRAWISDAFSSPTTRFDQADLSDVPYVLLSGRILADDFAELTELGPRTGISGTETGQSLVQRNVWTNTDPFGEPFSDVDDCAGWTTNTDSSGSRIGLNALPVEMGPAWDTWKTQRHWTSVLGQLCEAKSHLYCFEDGYVED